MKHWLRLLIVTWLAIGSALGLARESPPTVDRVLLADLPREARRTLALIKAGGPFPYERDGIVFNNFERLLPPVKRGYYREYTVKTPGERSRGARRIVAAGQPPVIFYYTADHYRSFRRIEE